MSPFVMLDLAAPPGRYTIIGCLHAVLPHITCSVGDDFLLQQGETCLRVPLGFENAWSWVAGFTNPLVAVQMFFFGEACVDLVFVELSIVLDSKNGTTNLQSNLEADHKWLAYTTELPTHSTSVAHSSTGARTTTLLSNSETSKNAFLMLRNTSLRANPTSYASQHRRGLFFVTLPGYHPRHIHYNGNDISSYNDLSPYPAHPERHFGCALSREPFVRSDITRAGRALKGSPREDAENPMIVDLIRYDLHVWLAKTIDNVPRKRGIVTATSRVASEMSTMLFSKYDGSHGHENRRPVIAVIGAGGAITALSDPDAE
ncbi:hypothetical protein F5141DRAFT_1059514 [Pisolithus sp. B1]|nr:hypothetical protein F5141DRAFT_1059514 [Pisolithus sp. B1]